jgi:hypothetical protein
MSDYAETVRRLRLLEKQCSEAINARKWKVAHDLAGQMVDESMSLRISCAFESWNQTDTERSPDDVVIGERLV